MNIDTIREIKRPSSKDEIREWRPGYAWLGGGTWLFSELQPSLDTLIDLGGLKWPALQASADGLEIAATCRIVELHDFEGPGEWHALPLIRKSLLSNTPIDRTGAAAILALIGEPWSIRELLGALESSDDQEKTADARAALLESGDEAAQKAVLAWEERNPHENEAGSYLEIGGRRLGPFYTFAELSLNNRPARIRYEMDKLHDRVMNVQGVIPPEPLEARP